MTAHISVQAITVELEPPHRHGQLRSCPAAISHLLPAAINFDSQIDTQLNTKRRTLPRTMTETVQAPEDAAAARAADQARIRKERREAKIKAGGSARLNKITGLGGGLPRGKSYQLVSCCVKDCSTLTRPNINRCSSPANALSSALRNCPSRRGQADSNTRVSTRWRPSRGRHLGTLLQAGNDRPDPPK